jgi:hypothetical protein
MVSRGFTQIENTGADDGGWISVCFWVLEAGRFRTISVLITGSLGCVFRLVGLTRERSRWQPGQVPSSLGITLILHVGHTTMMFFIFPSFEVRFMLPAQLNIKLTRSVSQLISGFL